MAANSEPPPTTSGTKAGASKEESGSRSLASLLGTITQLSGIITVVGVTIYLLGVITLLLPIYNTYDLSFATAWYMVSVVPKTVVAGHGVRSLVWPSLATVVPIALITVMLLTLGSLLWVGVRHAGRRARAAESDLSRGVLFITAVYAGYSVALGGVLLAVSSLFRSIRSEIFQTLLQYHGLTASLAYGIFALLCLVALFLLTMRAGTYTVKLIRSRTFPFESLRILGSLRVSLYLALYVGLIIVILSGLRLIIGLDLSQIEGYGQRLQNTWIGVISGLLFFVPMVLLLLILDRALSSETFDKLGLKFRAVGISSKIFFAMLVVGTSLSMIWEFFSGGAGIGTSVRNPREILGQTWEVTATSKSSLIGLIVFIFLFLIGLLLWAASKAVFPTVLGISGPTLIVLLASVMLFDTILFLVGLHIFSSTPAGSSEELIWALVILSTLILVLVLTVVVVALLMWRGGLYGLRLVKNRTFAPGGIKSLPTKTVAYSKSLMPNESTSAISTSVIRYAGFGFVVFYLTLFITFLYGAYIVWPLLNNIHSVASSESPFDELFKVLVLLSGLVSGVILYRSARFYTGGTFSLRNSLRRNIRGVIWCLGGAYGSSLVIASLIAFLEPPPLPQVEVTGDEDKLAQTMMSSGSEAPGFQSETKRLLAHAEGHWYLIDEREDNLIVLPERDDYAVQFPKHYQIVHSTGALKLEAPVAWDEVDESAQPKTRRKYAQVQLLVSTNVDDVTGTFGREPGVTLTANGGAAKIPEKTYEAIIEVHKSEVEMKAERAECQPTSPRDFKISNEGLIYRGKLFRWTNCGGEKGNTYTLRVAFPEHRKFYVVLQIDMPKSVPREEEKYILNHFWVDGTLLP